MNIRQFVTNDRDPLLALWERSVRATHHFLTEADIAELRPLVRDFLAIDGLELWVLTDRASTPIGFLGLEDDAVDALFLDPDHLRQGGGRRLVEHAQHLRPGPLRVDVNEQNPAATRFYQSLGFSVVGRSPLDATGRPFPLLHMRREAPPSSRG